MFNPAESEQQHPRCGDEMLMLCCMEFHVLCHRIELFFDIDVGVVVRNPVVTNLETRPSVEK